MTRAQMVREIRSLHRGMPGVPDQWGWWGWSEQPQWGGMWPAWWVALWWRRADLVALLDDLRGPWKDGGTMRVEVWSGNRKHARQLARGLVRLGIDVRTATRTAVLVPAKDTERVRELIAVALEHFPAAEGGA